MQSVAIKLTNASALSSLYILSNSMAFTQVWQKLHLDFHFSAKMANSETNCQGVVTHIESVEPGIKMKSMDQRANLY